MQRHFFITLLSILLFQFTDCHLFESTEVPRQEIERASLWSKQDIGPSFEQCDGLDSQAMGNCFETTITSTIQDYLNTFLPEALYRLDEKINIVFKIDTEGIITISEAEISSALAEAVPEFETILYQAVDQLPQAKPAIKSNVGTLVEIEFNLPIRIRAQEEN